MPQALGSRAHVTLLAERLAITHRQLADAADRVSAVDLTWRAGPTSPPIAFHLWHTGRWADRWAEAVRTARGAITPQRWEREGLAARWGFPSALGGGDTGMELPDEDAALLPFPTPAELAEYLRGAFADLEAAVAELDDDALLLAADNLLGDDAPLGDSLTRHLAHVARHLGMIEALRGVRGGHGTATV